MGWGNAGEIFNPVARALIDAGTSSQVKRDVLGKLIRELRDNDWDTCDESLEAFEYDADVVTAFAANEIYPAEQEELATFLSTSFGMAWVSAKKLAPKLLPLIREPVDEMRAKDSGP